MKRVAVVVPVYQKIFTKDEQFSLTCLSRRLREYPIIFFAPEGYKPTIELAGFHAEWKFFPEKYFKSVKSYSELLLKEEFYEAFLSYEYIFIYQLDGLVFDSNLQKWCDKKFSYIGAPWRRSFISFITHPSGKYSNIVGNGGMCLRNVRDHLRVFSCFKSEKPVFRYTDFIWATLLGRSRKKWLKSPISTYPFNEDGFWSLEASKYSKEFSVAPVAIASQFCLEKFPEYYYKHYLKGKSPFAAHAWAKYNKKWWLELLKSY